MATNKFNSKSPTIRRILREAQELSASPSADFSATPLESDLFEWHFTLRGPPNSVYADGLYHGRIVLPPTYPLRPPSFRFLTPSGRFEANREICLSISGHHEETWQPAWGVRTAIVALRAFMETDPRGQLGGLDASDTVRRRLASESVRFRCPACNRTNADILKESAEEEAKLKAEKDAQDGGSSADAGASSLSQDVVPPELKLVFRDQLEPKTADTHEGGSASAPNAAPANVTTAVASQPQQPQQPPLSQQLQQQQAQLLPQRAQHDQVPTSSGPYPPAPPAPGQAAVPAPTRTIPLSGDVSPHSAVTAAPATPATPATPVTQQRRIQQPVYAQPAPPARRRPSDEAVPLWVDRSLVILFVVLIGMLLRLAING